MQEPQPNYNYSNVVIIVGAPLGQMAVPIDQFAD